MVVMIEEDMLILMFDGGLESIERKNATCNGIHKFVKFFYEGHTNVKSSSMADVEKFRLQNDSLFKGGSVAILTDHITPHMVNHHGFM